MSTAELASDNLAVLYVCLFMALDFSFIVRIDLHVYAVALQRRAAAPARGRMRKPITRRRRAQAKLARIHYPLMLCAQT
eukprot:3591879-Pyramimonas_sp.AAC.1